MRHSGNSEGILIRTARLADAESIAGIHASSWRAAYRSLLPEARLSALSIVDHASRWQRNVEGQAAETLVAEDRANIVGFASSGHSRDPDANSSGTAELWALYVDPAVWGKGAGWRLWTATRGRLAERGYDEATLWVLEANRTARGFYERQGFVQDEGVARTIELLGALVPMVRYRLLLRS